MKILFTVGQIDYADHISVAYLSAVAKEMGHSTYFCSLKDHNFIEMVNEIGPKVIAYSSNIMTYADIVAAHKVALGLHDFTSIMGGPHATFSPETFPESQMDAYCVGEGEETFKEFLIKVENGDSFDKVHNLITHNGTNEVRPLIRNLDMLPMPDRDLTIANSHLKNASKKTFYATRGCPFKCTYCCNNYYNKLYLKKGPIVRRFSVSRVIDEILRVKSKYRMDFIKFGDDLFAFKADKWLEEFAEKYSSFVGIPFNCYLRIDRVNDDLLRLLKKSGCYSTKLSVDSVSPYIREEVLKRQMKKNINVEENLKLIRSYGINTFVNYMLALPKSTLKDDLDTISLSRKGKVVYTHYTTTDPMKGTMLHQQCLEEEYIDPSYEGDMEMLYKRSALSCFSKKDKDIRLNILLLGHWAANLPWPLNSLVLWAIKIIPPNKIFRKIYNLTDSYYNSHKVFRLQ